MLPTLNDVPSDFHFDDKFRPCSDVVFAITFSSKVLFARLCSAVYDKQITIAGEPLSQAAIRENDVTLNAIRFDVMAYTDSRQLFTMDMQRRYFEGRQERRGIYYMCRAISRQLVKEMMYEDVNPVHIAFILTDHKGAPRGVRKVGLCYLDTGELYNDLIELVLVYVPAVIREYTASDDNDLYVFSRYFAISSQDEATAFLEEFKENDLGRDLVLMYNRLIATYQELEEMENSPYFTQRLTEAQLDKARAEAAAKVEVRARAEGKAEGRAEITKILAELSKKGYDLDTALKMIEEGVDI